jgi:hypothetical protein
MRQPPVKRACRRYCPRTTYMSRFSSVELAGPAVRVPSPMQYGWRSLPEAFSGPALQPPPSI